MVDTFRNFIQTNLGLTLFEFILASLICLFVVFMMYCLILHAIEWRYWRFTPKFFILRFLNFCYLWIKGCFVIYLFLNWGNLFFNELLDNLDDGWADVATIIYFSFLLICFPTWLLSHEDPFRIYYGKHVNPCAYFLMEDYFTRRGVRLEIPDDIAYVYDYRDVYDAIERKKTIRLHPIPRKRRQMFLPKWREEFLKDKRIEKYDEYDDVE